MKRTTFIAPVESMRGNLSGKQDLRYANENNKAFGAPDGRQYARNYRASYIAARRAKDGLTYFAVKTKSASLINDASKERMALLGATGAVIGSILRQKKGSFFTNLLKIYGALQIQGVVAMDTSFRKWLFDNLYVMFQTRAAQFNLTARVGNTTITESIKNIYVATGQQTEGAEISNDVLVKFWSILTKYISGEAFNKSYAIKGTQLILLAKDGDSFSDIIAGGYNVCDLQIDDASLDNVMVGKVATLPFLAVTKSSAVEHPFTVKGDDPAELSDGGEFYLSNEIIPAE